VADRARRARRAPVVAGAVLAVLAVLAGCGGAPSAGPAHEIGERAGSQAADLDRGYVRLLPPLPQPGYDAEAIMYGFQVAMADFTDDHAAARRYLTPELARTWEPDTRTVVYANLRRVAPTEGEPGRFDFRVTPVAEVGLDHGFTLRSAEESYGARAVQLPGGQWRLSEVGPGTLLSLAGFQRAYRGVDVYFPAAHSAVLVPDHVFLPVAPSDLPTAMVRQLVEGPTSWLAPSVRRVAPPGTVVRSVEVDTTGAAHVLLGGTARRLSGEQRRLLLVALTWTLGDQLPDVKSVQLRVEGLPGETGPADVQDFASYDPDAFPAGSRASYVDAGHVQQLVREGQGPQPGVQPQLDGTTDPVAPVAAGGFAGVRPGRGSGGTDALVVYDGKRWRPVYRAPAVSEPTWMPDGSSVWTIAGEPDGTQRVIAVELSSTVSTDRVTVRQVAVDLAGSGLRTVGRLSRLRLSRDGTRVAFIRGPTGGTASDGRPYVARIHVTDGGGLSISGLRALAPACPSSVPQRCLTAAIDVAWADAANLVVLGNNNTSDPATHAPYLVSIDGSAVQPVGTAGLASDVSSITAAPGAPMLAVVPGAGHTDPAIYKQSGDSWARVVTGYAVRYPD